MKKMNCIVIDDEPLACKGIVEYIQEVGNLNLLAVLNSPVDAIKYLPDTDLMYLDINMPKISGLDFLKQIKNPPVTIITTAYPQFALEGFELDVIDYLVKPFSFSRFMKATTKAIEYHKLLTKTGGKENVHDEYFFIKSNGVLEKIQLSDIVAVESLSNYIIIHTVDKKVIAYLTLKQINEYLPDNLFLKVHKSFIVACLKIDKIDHDELVLGQLRVPVGSNFKDIVEQQIVSGKILKR